MRVLIAGGGLAGACAALWLAPHAEVTLLEAAAEGAPPGSGSAAAAGLVNPFTARRGHAAWRFEEALDALTETLDAAAATHLFRRTGVLRPAQDAAQATDFRARTAEHPAHAAWLEPEGVAEEWPDVAAPFGALWVPGGGSMSIAAMARAVLSAAMRRGATVRFGARVAGVDDEPAVTLATGERVGADRVLLALGGGFEALPLVDGLRLHRVKGQTIRVARPPDLGPLPALSAGGYVVPDGEALVLGATFEHRFDSLAPTPEAAVELTGGARRLLPTLADPDVLDQQAGVRVTRPGRRPLLGPVPGRPRVWAFTALGSKGLLAAPLLARMLPDAMLRGRPLPPEVGPAAAP